MARVSIIRLILCSRSLSVQAQLTACDDCCESDQQIGMSAFDSNITSDGPLIWSVGSTVERDNAYTESMNRYMRSFYLSTPPSLNVSDVTNFSGCGIYFYNVTAALQVGEDFTEYASFSCDTVLSSACQKDLMQQASDEVQLLVDPETYLDYTCGSIATRLSQSSVPESCILTGQQPTWGFTTGSGMLTSQLPTNTYTNDLVTDIAGRGFTFGSVRSPSDRGCNVTDSSAVNTLYAEAKYVSLPPGSEESKAFQNGTTPILTMFFNRPNQAQSAPFLPEPEIHLSCLKTIPTEEQQKTVNSGVGRIVAPFSSVFALLVVAALMLTAL